MEETLSAWPHLSRDHDVLLVIAGRISGVDGEKGKPRTPAACTGFVYNRPKKLT
jgi:hypothetical protein